MLSHDLISAEKYPILVNEQRENAFGDWRDFESSARSYAKSFPLVFERATGSRLISVEGVEYLDLITGAGVALLGHNHVAIRDAIVSAVDPVVSGLDLATVAKGQFFDAFLRILPDKMQGNVKIHCCGPTGADSIEALLKLSRIATGRSGVFSFSGSYHGMTQGALSVTSNLKSRSVGHHNGMDVVFCHFPYPYRGIGPFADEASATAISLSHIEMMLNDDHSGVNRPGVMLLECIQGEGGNIAAPLDFIIGLRKICDDYGILLAFDEIQSGMGRTGKWFAFEHYGITPDLFVVSKGVGGGLPLALLVYKKELDLWKSGDHIGTFRGQGLAFAAGAALIKTVVATGLLEVVTDSGRWLKEQLQVLVDRFLGAGEVRGMGLFLGLECRGNAGLSATEIASSVQSFLFNEKILIERGGRGGTVLRFLPALNISRSDLEAIIQCLHKAFARSEAA